ncbi:MAG: division/cell wall cluster transcriptional repressor MraZ [Myxococcales bacterium]|nr:division/cell wall cluster transcriptional repressor MraZ [Myxococcales bacterium]
MFKGQYEHALDAKGRVALPAAFRRDLSEQGDELLVVTPHIQAPCLVAYPRSEWLRFEDKVAALSQFDASATQLRRLVVGRALDCSMDKTGRILLPTTIRKVAEIEKTLVWVGQLRWIEIWSPAYLNGVAPMEANVPVTEQTLEKLTELGL